jgi:hypothetical protein
MEELDPSLFTGKKESTGGADAAAEKQKDAQRRHDIAALEAMIYHMVEALQEERHATHENVTRKQVVVFPILSSYVFIGRLLDSPRSKILFMFFFCRRRAQSVNSKRKRKKSKRPKLQLHRS